jgi:sigma-B regulation protein RsbU (phosphoserine phosphatase)
VQSMTEPYKILIVDDEPFNIDYLEQELEDLGYGSISASNGQEALDLISAESPDMILLDIMMPVMDGFEVLEKLKAHENWRHIPVVVISAMSDMDSVTKGIEMGADDYLPKPFDPILLLARLKACLEKKRLHDLEQQYLRGLERELEIGREIQADFLPKEILQPEGWEIAAFFEAAREVAGDFYDVFQISEEKIGLILGDVVDKGVGAALYMALFRSLLRATFCPAFFANSFWDHNNSENDHVKLLNKAVSLTNEYICCIHHSAAYATLFFGLLDLPSGGLDYVDAGHEPPLILNQGQVRLTLEPSGPGVGIFEEATFEVKSVQLQKGDILLIYSDGVTDVQNGKGELFGEESLMDLLVLKASSPESLLDHIVSNVRDFIGETPQYDDITLLAVRKVK